MIVVREGGWSPASLPTPFIRRPARRRDKMIQAARARRSYGAQRCRAAMRAVCAAVRIRLNVRRCAGGSAQ